VNLARSLALVAAISATASHAIGGHFAVDDATILDVGQCQVEIWGERADDAGALFHVGPACRVGPIELSLNAERIEPRGGGPLTLIGPQIKWATPVDDRVSVGVVASATWRGSAPHVVVATLYAPLSVRVAGPLLVSVDFGRDWLRDSVSRPHVGVSFEWQVTPAWTLVGERFRQFGGDFARLGVHWQPNASLGFDLSRARGLGPAAERAWTLGATLAFAAPTGARPAP